MLTAAPYRARVKLWFVICLLALPALLADDTAAVASTSPPAWLVRQARQAAARLADGSVGTAITYVAPASRFPRVVLTGRFVCDGCSHGPTGTRAPTGTVAELRFDGKTHQSRDFALCTSRAHCDASLCSFGACTYTQDALDAAFDALDARLRGIPGDPDPFARRPGMFACHIPFPVPQMRYIVGTCTTAIRFRSPHAAAVILVERWRPREFERDHWVRQPTRSHTWRLRETNDGWNIAITSTGDPAPQLPHGVSR